MLIKRPKLGRRHGSVRYLAFEPGIIESASYLLLRHMNVSQDELDGVQV
jgi:hypothetical protein